MLVGKRALVFAPTAWNKLHDETKIYAGYFRFIVLVALVVARALIYQEFSLSSSRFPSFNISASLALLAMLIMEHLEDHVVVQQLVPMSPLLPEFIQHDLEKDGRHGSLLSVDRRVVRFDDSQDIWRLDELDADGFKLQHQFGQASRKSDLQQKSGSSAKMCLGLSWNCLIN